MKTLFALVGAAVVGLFGIGIILALLSPNHINNSATVNRTDVASSASYEPSIDVSPYQLYADYHRNEVSADSMYKGRKLKVAAIVESINKDAFDQTYLVLADGNEFSGVHAKLQASEVARAGQLSRGEEVNLGCKGGTMIIGTPMLDDCIFSQPSTQLPAPTLPSPYYVQPAAPSPTVVRAAPAAAAAPPLSVDDYQDQFLAVMQSHWVVPAGVPVETHAEIKVNVAPDGRLYNGVVAKPSGFPTLDQSCLDALQKMAQYDPTPDGQAMEIDFGCRVKR